MILGNSNGNNKGKKYLRKDTIDIVYANEANVFNEWISDNYTLLSKSLKKKCIYNDDVFNETYKNMYEKILYSGVEIKDYESYFMRSYYTNMINSRKKESRYCELLPDPNEEDIDIDHYKCLESEQRELSKDILSYVYSKYDLREFELFRMYMSLKPAVNYDTLSGITGVHSHRIQKIISTIKKDILNNEYFVKQAQDILK